jgi:PmbA protein
MFSHKPEQLKELVAFLLAEAKKLGATDAAAELSEGHGLSVSTRKGDIETIEQNRDKQAGVTVFIGQRRGNAGTSDFSKASLKASVEAAFHIAKHTAEDDCAGLAPADLLEKHPKDLDLYHPWKINTEDAVEIARAAEQGAFAISKNITNSDGASVSAQQSHFMLGTTNGFMGGYAVSRHYISCTPIASASLKPGAPMQRDDWYTTSRVPEELARPERVGAYAAKRALARLGARSISTRHCPVIFEAPLAVGLLGAYVQATSGGALYRQSSFLLDSLGQSVFPAHIDIFEEPHAKRLTGSAPFDEEGVRTKARKVVDAGVVQGYFLSTYSAKKLGMQTTGNAGGSHHLRMTSRLTKVSDHLPALLKKMGTGLLVTDLMGQGVNYVNGDYSRGAFGYWVENGVIVHPVEEITIAGNLRDMFSKIVAIGHDTLVRGTKETGSILIENMTVGGR